MYNLSAVSIPKSPVGLSGSEKGDIVKYHPNLYDVQVPRDVLVRYLQQPMMWSNFQYRGSKRSQSTCKLSTELLVFDIDNNTPFDIIKSAFHDIFESVIIMPSGGWTPEYEKYRVIIPFEKIELMSDNHYKMIMKYIADKLPFEVDTKPFETGRLYFSDKHPLKEAYDSGGINQSNILVRAMIYGSIEEDKPNLSLLKPARVRNKKYSDQIMPEYLVNNVLYKKYLDDIYSGNCHNGMIAMVGYLKKCGCQPMDIESHLREISGFGGCSPSEDQLKNRIRLAYS